MGLALGVQSTWTVNVVPAGAVPTTSFTMVTVLATDVPAPLGTAASPTVAPANAATNTIRNAVCMSLSRSVLPVNRRTLQRRPTHTCGHREPGLDHACSQHRVDEQTRTRLRPPPHRPVGGPPHGRRHHPDHQRDLDR